MKNVILFVCLISMMGCATDERTTIRQAFDEVEQGICGSGCDPSDPQAYVECIANECGGDGPGGGGGGTGGGGGYGSAPCGSWSNYGCTEWTCTMGNSGNEERTCTYRRVCPDGGVEEQTNTEYRYASRCDIGA